MGFAISPVTSARELELFLRVPAILRPENYVNTIPGRWVRPLLDRRRNPYFRHTDHVLLLARRDGRAVGRVAVFVDHLCNRALGQQVGHFGLFDCINSPRVAAQLLEAAERWLQSNRVFVSRGPMGPAMRLGTGLLVEGHGREPMPGMTFDPPELSALVEAAGYEPHRDLHAYRLLTSGLSSALTRSADAARRRTGLVLRSFRSGSFENDITEIRDVINDLSGLGRACTPWTVDEVRWMARKLWHILDHSAVLIVEQDGVPVAVGMALRNVREVLEGRSPRPSLVDSVLVATSLKMKQIRSARIMLLAVRPRFAEGEGDLSALLLAELLGRLSLLNVKWVEISLVDPTDLPLVELMAETGAEIYKTYRIFQKILPDE